MNFTSAQVNLKLGAIWSYRLAYGNPVLLGFLVAHVGIVFLLFSSLLLYSHRSCKVPRKTHFSIIQRLYHVHLGQPTFTSILPYSLKPSYSPLHVVYIITWVKWNRVFVTTSVFLSFVPGCLVAWLFQILQHSRNSNISHWLDNTQQQLVTCCKDSLGICVCKQNLRKKW